MPDTVSMEERIRIVLTEAIGDYRKDLNLLDELDSYFDGITATDLDRFKTWLLAHEIKIVQGFPMPEASSFPCYTILPGSGAEKDGQAAFGDIFGYSTRISETDPDGKAKKLKGQFTRGIDWETSVQIGSWAIKGDLTPMLHSFAQKILFERKGQFLSNRIQTVKLSEESLQIDQSQYPEIPFVRVLNVRVDQEVSFLQKEIPAYLRRKSAILPGHFFVG